MLSPEDAEGRSRKWHLGGAPRLLLPNPPQGPTSRVNIVSVAMLAVFVLMFELVARLLTAQWAFADHIETRERWFPFLK